ncbi:MAG: cysteine--tRNA ligase [Erysipelotrichales bacterium]|nr:cysteine--tRNA ligase [Erysipelotrichales bacterium]
MKLYNTLTRKEEEFTPVEEGKVKIYTCGPTVYHYAHIGNMRNYIGHDILVRTFKYLGYDVTRAMNITDVGHLTSDSDSGEDKMEVAKRRENKTAYEIAKFYTDAFFKDFDDLNNLRPDIVSPATENIDMYIKMIEKLLKDDIAYISGGNVYFDISKVKDYYCLTNHQEDKMVVGVREGVEFDNNKRNQADFALWFTTSKFENHEMLWDSPFGKGYPGWHIECSGISIKYLGEYLDIHGGGVDNIFPHHTNEIAQSEAYLGHKWCNYWFHNEHLLDDTGKMSKSHGEFLTIQLLKDKGYDPIGFRFLCLNSHYRKPLLFSYDGLNQAEATLKKLRNRISNIEDIGEVDEGEFMNYNDKFVSALEDDLNTANALSVLYELLKDEQVNGHTKLELIKKFDKVFAVELIKEKETIENDEEILSLIEKRAKAKKAKDFELADSIRNDLYEKGIELIDTREGTTYKIIGS